MSFVNVNRNHWKLLYINAVNQTVYLVDPALSNTEATDSNIAAKKFSEYLIMRRTCYGKSDWVDNKWKGGCLSHPTQKDGNSCGVIVTLMAMELMKAFPDIPCMKFRTSSVEMASERRRLALKILKESVFDISIHCGMCSMTKPPGTGPPVTHWIQCNGCGRWYHVQCLGMTSQELRNQQKTNVHYLRWYKYWYWYLCASVAQVDTSPSLGHCKNTRHTD
ncbi:uncharacterized protein LOC144027138 [Festucalex cinctus]